VLTLLAFCAESLAAQGGCTPAQAESSLAFWRGAGVILLQGEETLSSRETAKDGKYGGEASTVSAPPAHTVESTQSSPASPTETPRAPAKKATPEGTLPRYTSEELADLLESRAEARTFINECANVWGKMFNVCEVNVLLGLVDYLGLEWDYVLTLLAFCAESLDRQGRKRSLRYFEKTAHELYDEGVVDLITLQEKLRRVEQSREAEGRLRRMTGIGERELTANEKKVFSKWLYDYGYGMDVITMAFETTVEAKGSYNVKYMDAVLTNWHNAGLTTPAAITAHNEQYRAEHTPPPSAPAPRREGGKATDYKSSFDTDDFFFDAVRRSLGEDFDVEELKRAETDRKDPRG
jgi:DnaD/phage-associated family protein